MKITQKIILVALSFIFSTAIFNTTLLSQDTKKKPQASKPTPVGRCDLETIRRTTEQIFKLLHEERFEFKGIDRQMIVDAIKHRCVDPNARDGEGTTILMYAGYLGPKGEDIARLLIEQGADVNAVAKKGYTALLCAAQGGNVGVTKLLFEHGAKLSSDRFGYTALELAAQKGHAEEISYLVSIGADPNEGVASKAPLLYALENNQEKAAEALINAGADPNVVDHEGRTALFVAAREGFWDLFKKMKAKGADIQKALDRKPQRVPKKQTPYDYFREPLYGGTHEFDLDFPDMYGEEFDDYYDIPNL